MLTSKLARAICRAQEFCDDNEVHALVATLDLPEGGQALMYTRCMDVSQGYLDVEDVEEFYAEAMNEVH